MRSNDAFFASAKISEKKKNFIYFSLDFFKDF